MDQPEEPPEFFYKYRSMRDSEQRGFLQDILLHNRLYWSSPKQFNDPFDCSPVPTLKGTKAQRHAYVSRLAQTYMKGHPRHERRNIKRRMTANDLRTMEAGLNRIFYDRLAEVGVCSLSEVCDDVLMWSHYADSHQGICLRFKPTRMDRDFYLAFKVHYSPERPVVNVLNATADDWAKGALLTKADYWGYEREWRMFDVERVGSHEFRAGLLDAVVLGALISPDNEALVRAWASARSSPTKLLKASFDQSQFRLNITDT